MSVDFSLSELALIRVLLQIHCKSCLHQLTIIEPRVAVGLATELRTQGADSFSALEKICKVMS